MVFEIGDKIRLIGSDGYNWNYYTIVEIDFQLGCYILDAGDDTFGTLLAFENAYKLTMYNLVEDD